MQSTDKPPCALPAPPCSRRHSRPSSLPAVSSLAVAAEMQPSGLELMNGQVLPAFLLCSALLVIKMYVVAIITGQVRLRKKVCAALWDPQSRVRALTSPAAAGKAGVADPLPGSHPGPGAAWEGPAPPSPVRWLLRGPHVRDPWLSLF